MSFLTNGQRKALQKYLTNFEENEDSYFKNYIKNLDEDSIREEYKSRENNLPIVFSIMEESFSHDINYIVSMAKEDEKIEINKILFYYIHRI